MGARLGKMQECAPDRETFWKGAAPDRYAQQATATDWAANGSGRRFAERNQNTLRPVKTAPNL